MKQFFIYIFFLLLSLVGCKTKHIAPPIHSIDNQLTSEDILQKHRDNNPVFESLSASIQIEIKNSKKTQSLPFSLRLKKNKVIWISAPLGLAKILLTPDKVQFYNKLDKSYYEGSYEVSKELIGVELSFDMVENILLGELPLQVKKALIIPQGDGYKGEFEVEEHHINFILNTLFRLSQMDINTNQEVVSVNYSYQMVQENILPTQINLESKNSKDQSTTNININLSNVVLNPSMNFPYSTPEGYEPITF